MTGKSSASDLARRLAEDCEAVCREYLSSGRRCGNYWMVGDVKNTPGRSMHVRLTGPECGKGAAGGWVDEATGEFGDLLDIIQHRCGITAFRDVADEARRFLSLPRPQPDPEPEITTRKPPAASGSPDAARRLFAMAKPLAGTLAERYLQARGIPFATRERSLRFHPGCYFRDFATERARYPR